KETKMTKEFYLPMLKSKDGEFKALFTLSSEHKKRIVPLFEITYIEYDHTTNQKPKTLKEHLVNFSKKVAKNWPTNNLFIDTNLLKDKDVEGVECIEFVFHELSKIQIFPMPIVYTSTPQYLLDCTDRILGAYHIEEIGIRITIEDITSSSFEKNLNNVLSS